MSKKPFTSKFMSGDNDIGVVIGMMLENPGIENQNPKRVGIGLSDKLYWRSINPHASWQWHCYKKVGNKRWESLCGGSTICCTDGQDIRRPKPLMRCAECDIAEAKRRGWDEPAT